MKEGEKLNLSKMLGSLGRYGIELGGCFPETRRRRNERAGRRKKAQK